MENDIIYQNLESKIDEKNIIKSIIHDVRESEKMDKWEKLIKENDNDWDKISRFKYLEEEFIRYYKDKVNWNYIHMYQRLSESFRKEFHNKFRRRIRYRNRRASRGILIN